MSKERKVVVIGGGTGAPTVLRSLVDVGIYADAICAATDNGGKTGIIRTDERDGVIAISDLLRSQMAMIDRTRNHEAQINALTELMSITDERNRTLGYFIYYAMLEHYKNDIEKVHDHLHRLTGINFSGIAIPVTLESSHISFKTITGDTYHGERELDNQSFTKNTITDVWLDPQVPATPFAIKTILEASDIVIAPGSLYGSIIANFLPTGMPEALNNTQAKTILVTNLVSDRNQTHELSPLEYVKILGRYMNKPKPVDVILAPDVSRQEFELANPKTTTRYDNEHSHFLGWTKEDFLAVEQLGISVVLANIYSITENLHRIRHNTTTLGPELKRIIESV